MSWWHEKRWQRWQQRHPFPERTWAQVLSALPILEGLDEKERVRLGARSWRLLFELRLRLPEGLEWDAAQGLSLCAQIALMTLAWPEEHAHEALADVREVILLPGPFRRQVQEMDEAGVMHEFEDERAGETSWQGPVALSLEELAQSGDWSGFNIVIHEFAHRIDMTGDGDVNGMPALPRGITSREWYDTFISAWQSLQATLERGEPAPIDDYAATHPSEFFAVCCEYFFTAPDTLNTTWPDLYRLMTRFFGQNPLLRLPIKERACSE